MAWRIEDAVAHGEIDNTVEGRTTGRIWLVGRADPLILSLDGDCWRDLAGTRLQFENPQPKTHAEALELDLDQSGIIGDMTASRKSKIPSVTEEEFNVLFQSQQEIPFQWKNTLYLEWFSEINGRVVIESSNYLLTISPHEWQMDADEEAAQKLANLNSMRDFMAQVIGRRDSEAPGSEVTAELDEFAWEERLKESDRLTDAYQEVLEKYLEDADSEKKEAFVMGWDSLLDALAEREESQWNQNDSNAYDVFEDGESELPEDELGCLEEDDSRSGDEHPLQRKAQELAMRAMDLIERDTSPASPSYQLVTHLLQVSGKLAGVLHGRESGYEPETGFVLAVLKRCLNWLNEAIGVCQQLIGIEQDPAQCAALEALRGSAFEIRDGIVELRRKLK